MPNIKQQKKRVRIAAEERLENLRYRSTIKTLDEAALDCGRRRRQGAVETEHKSLVKLIDRAVARGALHRNAGARKKSQAARVRRRPRLRSSSRVRSDARAVIVDQRALELELVREPRAALERVVELREPDERIVELSR